MLFVYKYQKSKTGQGLSQDKQATYRRNFTHLSDEELTRAVRDQELTAGQIAMIYGLTEYKIRHHAAHLNLEFPFVPNRQAVLTKAQASRLLRKYTVPTIRKKFGVDLTSLRKALKIPGKEVRRMEIYRLASEADRLYSGKNFTSRKTAERLGKTWRETLTLLSKAGSTKHCRTLTRERVAQLAEEGFTDLDIARFASDIKHTNPHDMARAERKVAKLRREAGIKANKPPKKPKFYTRQGNNK